MFTELLRYNGSMDRRKEMDATPKLTYYIETYGLAFVAGMLFGIILLLVIV